MTSPLVLASGSARRRALLTQLGIPFHAIATNADETVPKGLPATAAVLAIAERKLDAYRANAGTSRRASHVLAVDTDVFLNGRLLGKPGDAAAAHAMLTEIQGKAHIVYSGLVLEDPQGVRRRAVEATTVHLVPLADEQIRSYVATQEPFDKAGGYAVQGQAAAFIRRVDGDYSNVVGLPLRPLLRLLSEARFELPAHLRVS